VVINLFIAVVINNLEAAKAEQSAAVDALHAYATLLRQLKELQEQISKCERTLRLRSWDTLKEQDGIRTLEYNQSLAEKSEAPRGGQENA
jgi:hypothetical protein